MKLKWQKLKWQKLKQSEIEIVFQMAIVVRQNTHQRTYEKWTEADID